MSETNPPPTTVPPTDQPGTQPPAQPPTQPPTQPPAPSGNPPAQSGTPDVHGLLTRLETVISGLPERTANAVREASPQHVPNPTAQQQPGQGQQQQPPGTNPASKTKGGPSRIARWWHGIE
jgi:hypothetical protein